MESILFQREALIQFLSIVTRSIFLNWTNYDQVMH